MPNDEPAADLCDIVLVGGGHSHVGVIKRFATQPLPGVRLTLICRDTHTPYSGMLPGYIAGHYDYDEVHIDLRRLARFAAARFYRDEVIGLDREKRQVLCRARPPVAYDRLSINIGSMPAVDLVDGALENTTPVKPIRHFNERWLSLLERVRLYGGPLTIAVVGAGAGGVELALAMHYRLRREIEQVTGKPDDLTVHLLAGEHDILPTHNAAVRRSFERLLNERQIVVHRAAEVIQVCAGRLRTRSGETLKADEIVWVTQAAAAAWLRDTGLALDGDGFIAVRETLQTLSDPLIFAAGDCAAPVGRRLAKAGVFAVRQGRTLANNLRRSLRQQPLRAWRAQRRWLALISTGDRYAVASRGILHAEGAWVWRWKDWIDRRFMTGFRDLPRPTGQSDRHQALRQASAADEAKATAVLSRVLAAMPPVAHGKLPGRACASDELSIVHAAPGKTLRQTLCALPVGVDDPWLWTQIAANHALDEVFAQGGQAHSATVIVTLPPGPDEKIEASLFDLLSGATAVLDDAACPLSGVRVNMGEELALGFAITTLFHEEPASAQGGMRPGDVLILTKAVGVGTLFAGHARLQAKGRWIDEALRSMQRSNRLAAKCLREHLATACSKVHGRGILGHLIEMARPSGVDAQIDLDQLPVLDGALETGAAGSVDARQVANLRLRDALLEPPAAAGHRHYPLLFDPQIAGGLLASVAPEQADACLRALRSLGYEKAARIGHVLPASEHGGRIVLRCRTS